MTLDEIVDTILTYRLRIRQLEQALAEATQPKPTPPESACPPSKSSTKA